MSDFEVSENDIYPIYRPPYYKVFLRCEKCGHDTEMECADITDALHMHEVSWVHQAFQYLWRWNGKGEVMHNLKKAVWCIERAMSVLCRRERVDKSKLSCDDCWFGRFGKCENSSVSAFGTADGRVQGCSGFASIEKARKQWKKENK